MTATRRMTTAPVATNRSVPVNVSSTLPPDVLEKVRRHVIERQLSRGAAIAELVADGLKARQQARESMR